MPGTLALTMRMQPCAFTKKAHQAPNTDSAKSVLDALTNLVEQLLLDELHLTVLPPHTKHTHNTRETSMKLCA